MTHKAQQFGLSKIYRSEEPEFLQRHMTQYEQNCLEIDQVINGTAFGESLHIEIADPENPIERGLSAWDIYGERWSFFSGSPGLDCHTLLTTDHPKMQMKAMAWTHQFRNARVFCLQPGHNNDSWVPYGAVAKHSMRGQTYLTLKICFDWLLWCSQDQ